MAAVKTAKKTPDRKARTINVVNFAPGKSAKPATTSPKKLSALDAAARVLTEVRKPMTTRDLVETMAAKGYWTSPSGKTPHATLYSAILREITVKDKEARFKKTERGRFAAR